MAKAPTITDVTSGFASATATNANNDAIQAAFENTVSRDGSTPNTMAADFDLNGYNILNVGSVNGADLTTLVLDATEIQESTANVPLLSVAFSYNSRDEFITATVPDVAQRVSVNVDLRNSGSTAGRHVIDYIKVSSGYSKTTAAVTSADGAFWVPAGPVTPLHFGASGGAAGRQPTLLSSVFDTLAEAQEEYPKVEALTESTDVAGFQKAVDFIRDSAFTTDSDFGFSEERVIASDVVLHIPRGVYFINKPIDLTSIRNNHCHTFIKGDQAVLVAQAAGKTCLDITDSAACIISDIIILGDWTSSGVPRSGIQMGRRGDGRTSSGHTLSNVHIVGKFKLAGVHNYASEVTGFTNLQVDNNLDNRRHYFNYDNGSAGTLASDEDVTFAGGTGTIVRATDGGATGSAVVLVKTGTLSDGTTITQTSDSKTFDVNGTPVAEPDGDGPDGRSYGIVQDGENVFSMVSDYTTDAATGTAASFLMDRGDKMDIRHSGRGDGMFLCRDRNHNYSGSYFVSDDYDGGAGIVLYSNGPDQISINLNLTNCHVESDLGDADSSTGVDYGVKFDSASGSQDIVVSGLTYHDNTSNVSIATFGRTSNIASVTFINSEISIHEVNRNNGQVLFETPASVTFDGEIRTNDPSDDYLNIADLADFTGHVRAADITDTASLHDTASYRLTDGARDVQVSHLDGMVDSSGDFFLNVVSRADADLASLKASSSGWVFAVGGTSKLNVTGSGVYPQTADDYQLGLSSKEFLRVHANQYRVSNIKVVGAQEAAIADSTGGGDDQVKINAILAALRSHGLIDT